MANDFNVPEIQPKQGKRPDLDQNFGNDVKDPAVQAKTKLQLLAYDDTGVSKAAGKTEKPAPKPEPVTEKPKSIAFNKENLPKGPNAPQVTFDAQGRIQNIIPTLDAYNKGAPSIMFTYVDDKSTKLATISELRNGQKPTSHPAAEGEALDEKGNYIRPEKIKVDGKEQNVTRIHRPGTTLDTDYKEAPLVLADGSKAINYFDAKDHSVSVDYFDKEGHPLKTYRNQSATQLVEIDHVKGNTTVWNKHVIKHPAAQDRIVFQGQQIREAGKTLANPVDRGLRQHLDFNNRAELVYTLPDGTYNVVDGRDRLKQAGVSTIMGPDLKNGLTFKYDDKTTSDGKPIIAQVDFMHNGKPREAWKPEKGAEHTRLDNGEFIYKNKNGQKVLLKPDQSENIYKVGEGKEPDLLTAVNFPDGSKRSFVYGNPADPACPAEIKSSVIAANGDTMIHTFSLDQTPPLPEPPKPAQNADKDKDYLEAKQSYLDSFVQHWKCTVEKVSSGKNDAKAAVKPEETEAKFVDVFALELLANGDFEATSSSSDNNRYLFPVHGMAVASPIAAPLHGLNGRFDRARANYDKLYEKYKLPEKIQSMPPTQRINGKLVFKSAIGKDPELLDKYAREYMHAQLGLPNLSLPPDLSKLSQAQRDEHVRDMSCQYEEAAAKLEAMRRAGKLPK